MITVCINCKHIVKPVNHNFPRMDQCVCDVELIETQNYVTFNPSGMIHNKRCMDVNTEGKCSNYEELS